MKTYSEPNAYDVIQRDVENNFHSYIDRTPSEVKVICVVGAYHGIEIHKLLRNYPNANIYAFEAYPPHFEVLSRNFVNNPRVKLFNKAVTSKKGKVDFFQLTIDGNGSILPFQGDKFDGCAEGVAISETIKVDSVALRDLMGEQDIDLLWVDVQGAELEVLKGVDLQKCKSLFLEIHTHEYRVLANKEPYKGQCYKEDLENYLFTHTLHSMGLDNANGNGQGNSFWIKKFKPSLRGSY